MKTSVIGIQSFLKFAKPSTNAIDFPYSRASSRITFAGYSVVTVNLAPLTFANAASSFNDSLGIALAIVKSQPLLTISRSVSLVAIFITLFCPRRNRQPWSVERMEILS